MFKEVTVDTLSQLLFDCYQLAVPPVLSEKYHLGQIVDNHDLSISAWFAAWCCLMEVRATFRATKIFLVLFEIPCETKLIINLS